MRKYVFRTLAFAALFCMLLTVSVFAEDALITGNDVNFRSGPGTDYAIYDCLPKGTVVTVTDRSNGEWYGVTYGGRSGFIASAYLKISSTSSEPVNTEPVNTEPVNTEPVNTEPAENEPTPTSTASSGKINAMYVRFRSGPSTDHSILGEYNKGTAVTVTGSTNGWYAVTIKGVSGYVYASYVTLSDNASVPEVEPDPQPTPTPTPTPTPVPEQTEVDPSGGTPGHIKGDYVYFRSGPDTTYAIYDTLANGTKLSINGRTGKWMSVTIRGTTGYVYSSYVVSDGGAVAELPDPTPAPTPTPTPTETTTSSTPGYITGNDVRFRSGPSTEYGVLGTYNYGKALTITGSSGQWKAVTIDGTAGYVYGQYVAEGRVTTEVADDPNTSDLGKRIVQYALQYEGYPYVWGGTSPSGFDCSGFTTYVYGHFGITLNRVACDQARNGVAVNTNALQPGDLLCFYSSADYIGHVGIYIGNNKFIHASTYTTGVIISELSGYYNTRGFIARRVI